MAVHRHALSSHSWRPAPNWTSVAPSVPVRYILPVLLGIVVTACSPDPSGDDTSDQPQVHVDTLSYHENGAPNAVAVQRGDSVLERRTYRRTGVVRRVVSGDSVQTYFDLNDPDSAAVLQDYLQGEWRNLSADTSRDQASAFYVFDSERLTFKTPSRTPLESVRVEYKDDQKLVTGSGMAVRAEIISFDTVQVTDYTLVRLPAVDSP